MNNKYYKKIGIKILVLLVVLIGIFLLYKLAMFYLPFLIAILIASIIEPFVKFLMKRLKLKRKMACTISLLLIITIVGSLITLGITKLISECTSLISNSNEYFQVVYDNAMNFINEAQEGKTIIPKELVEIIKDSAGGIIDGLKVIAINTGKSIISTVSSIPTMVTYTIITILAIIFTCYDRQYVLNQIKGQVPKKWVEKVKEIYTEMCSVSWNYIKAEARLSFICFILVFVSLLIFDMAGLGVEYPILMAVIIGFIDLLPLFGAGAVMVPWSIYLAVTGNIPLALAIIILWGAWAVLKQFLEPKMVSKQMGMHPIFTLVGMYTGFRLMGVFGLMVGPILLLIISNVFKELLRKGVLKSFFEME
ncbi:MAG: sporulation integral membrane protein YtvI [Clostridiales bacterium]|nr:sporulation integral membrane protein YtvI [Clostridiales bacterium]